MTNQPGTGSTTGSGSLTDTASDVTRQAGDQARQVAGEAQQQAREVATEVKEHAADLLDQTRSQARQQAEESTRHLAQGLHSLGDQIQAMRDGRTDEAGSVAGYADNARRRIESLADRLEQGGVDGVASDLARFARRRPGMFLLSCAGAGFALARLVRANAGGGNSSGMSSQPAHTTGGLAPPTSPGIAGVSTSAPSMSTVAGTGTGTGSRMTAEPLGSEPELPPRTGTARP